MSDLTGACAGSDESSPGSGRDRPGHGATARLAAVAAGPNLAGAAGGRDVAETGRRACARVVVEGDLRRTSIEAQVRVADRSSAGDTAGSDGQRVARGQVDGAVRGAG